MLREVGPVPFPEFTGERVYMVPFRMAEGLPAALARWQPTVNAMMHRSWSDGHIYIMIDQRTVPAGETHRRPGAHIDGNWLADADTHGGSHGGRHRPTKRADAGDRWSVEDFAPEALILASDVYGCDGWVGSTETVRDSIRAGGSCADVALEEFQRVPLAPNVAWAGNVTFVHESVPIPSGSRRSLVRLNVPGMAI